MRKVFVNGIEVQDFSDDEGLPTVKEMIDTTRLHIYKFKGIKVSIELNWRNENKELILLERAYKFAKQYL